VDVTGSPEQRTVLVVEDDDATRAFLMDNLTADGFRAAGASGVGEGLRAIEVRQPSLVVLDLGLEDGNGLTLLDRVRAADGLASRIDPDLPVIVLSGRVGDADRVRSFARGADDHLNKPFLSFSAAGNPGRGAGWPSREGAREAPWSSRRRAMRRTVGSRRHPRGEAKPRRDGI
jgi:CheY-like chemotaxis protein